MGERALKRKLIAIAFLPLFIGFASAAAYSSYNGISTTKLDIASAPIDLTANVNVTGYGQCGPQGFLEDGYDSSVPPYLSISAMGGNTVVMNESNRILIQHLTDSEGRGIPLSTASTAGSFILHFTVSNYVPGEWFQITLVFRGVSAAVNLGSPSFFYNLSPNSMTNLSLNTNPQYGGAYLQTSSQHFTPQGIQAEDMNYAYMIGPYSHQFLPNNYLKFFEEGQYFTNTTLTPGTFSSNPQGGTPDAAGFCLDFGLSSWSSMPASPLSLTVYVPVS